MSGEKYKARQWARIAFILGVISIIAPPAAYSQHLDRNAKPISLDSKNLTHLRDSRNVSSVVGWVARAARGSVFDPPPN